ncbi:hypothetical protein FRB90_007866, partial [Tulasnella sp. 427]
MFVPRASAPTRARPAGGRTPSTAPVRQSEKTDDPEPEDSHHPELGKSPTIPPVGQERPTSPDFDGPPRNPYMPPTNPGPLPDTKTDAEASYRYNPDTRATVSFESPNRLSKKLESPTPKDKPISPIWPSPPWRARSLPKEPPTDEELLAIKDKMTKEWEKEWTDIQQAMGPEKAERFRNDMLEAIGGTTRGNTIPPYQPRTFANIGYIPPNPYARHTPAPSYRSPTPFL